MDFLINCPWYVALSLAILPLIAVSCIAAAFFEKDDACNPVCTVCGCYLVHDDNICLYCMNHIERKIERENDMDEMAESMKRNSLED